METFSKVKLPRIGLGGAGIGNLYRAISDEAANQTIQTAWDAGIRYFDTAPRYGCGLSEARLGVFLLAQSRKKYIISTKVGRVLKSGKQNINASMFHSTPDYYEQFDYSYDGIMHSFEESLARLRTDYIDILLVHDIGQLTHGDAHTEMLKIFLTSGITALQSLRDQKIIRAVGLGVNEWEVCHDIFPHLEIEYLMLAGNITLLEQSVPNDFFAICRERDVSVIAAGPYNSGILAGGKHYNYTEANQEIIIRVEKIRRVCQSFGVALPHAAIQFPFHYPQIISVVAGAQTAEEVMVLAEGFQQNIPSELWQVLLEQKLISNQETCQFEGSNNFL